MQRLLCLLVAAGPLLLLSGSATASDPWNPSCAATPAEQRAPAPLAAAARRFFPWVSRANSLHDGPVYLVALSSHTAISRDGDFRDSGDYFLHRALIAVAPSYSGPVTVSGSRLGRPAARATLGFSTNGANHCTVSSPDVLCGNKAHRFAPSLRIGARRGWRIVETELRIGRTGCFRITATGDHLRARIPLEIPGPDWGPHGWR